MGKHPLHYWTDEEIEELKRLAPLHLGAVGVAEEMARKFNRQFTRHSVRWKAMDIECPMTYPVEPATVLAEDSTPEDIDAAGTLAAKAKHARNLAEENRILRERVGELQEMATAIRETCATLKPEPMRFKAKPSKKSLGTYSAVAVVGDWHTGEVIEKKDTAGWGIYNLTVQAERVKRYGEKVLHWLETQRSGLNIPILRVPVLGDMVAGDIHYELSVTNEVPVPVAACLAGKMLAELVAGWAPHAARVFVDIVGQANHDRLTMKPQHKQGALNSWNYVVFRFAEQILKEHENVEVTFHEDSPAELDYDGLTVLAMHGHQVQSWAGIPAYGMQRMQGRLAMGYMAHGRPFHTMLCGHWHQPFELPGWIVNGCLSGSSEYDRNAGRYAAPSQTSFLWHRKFGAFNKTSWDLLE